MTATLELTQQAGSIVLPTDWTQLRSGPADSAAPNSGTDVVVTATLVATPGVTCSVRIRSRATGTTSVARTVTDTAGVFRLGPIVAATGTDIIDLEAKRDTGTGGIVVVSVAGLQGTLGGGDGGTVTAIITQPSNQTVQVGQQATFTVTAVGENITATVERSQAGAGGPWNQVSTGFTYNYTPNNISEDGDLYRFIVTGDNDPGGTPVTSSSALLTVTADPGTPAVIQVEPSDQAVDVGDTATFTAQATGIDSWNLYRRTTGTGNGTDIGGGVSPWGSDIVDHDHTNAQLAEDGWEYRFGLIGTDAVEVFTRWALLTVNAGPAGGPMLTDVKRGG